MPSELPQTLAAFKVGPALAMGCTMVIKPSPETVLDTYTFAESVIEAGIPAGVINVAPGGSETGAYLVSHRDIDKVAFTGSTGAGRQIAEACGRLLRPVTLELGGKSAAIVLDDADLSSRLEQIFNSTLLNNGQACYLGTRVLAPASLATTRSSTPSPPSPAASKSATLSTRLPRSARSSQPASGTGSRATSPRAAVGARVTVGGGRPAELDRGWFVEPTVFADVDNHSTIAKEEIFGPVLAVIPYDGIDDAVRIANDSDFGLGGTVWTTDADRGEAVARRIQTGTIGINDYVPTRPHPSVVSRQAASA